MVTLFFLEGSGSVSHLCLHTAWKEAGPTVVCVGGRADAKFPQKIRAENPFVKLILLISIFARNRSGKGGGTSEKKWPWERQATWAASGSLLRSKPGVLSAKVS